MPTRLANARWEGTLEEGTGRFWLGNGSMEGNYSFASRFESGSGTNPEELLGAAHASCFTMALSLVLGEAGFAPEYVEATARVTIHPRKGGGFDITESQLVCDASVPGIDSGAFQRCAEAARANCPVSRALAGVRITLESVLHQKK